MKSDKYTGQSAPTDVEYRGQMAMYHRNLPNLDEYGYIERNKDSRKVHRRRRSESVQSLPNWGNDNAKTSDRSGQLKP